MKERPILFSAPMVRALLDGTKTQTRRVVKPQPFAITSDGVPFVQTADDEKFGRLGKVIVCPYGQPGDRLWVREAWAPLTIGHAYSADPIWNSSPSGRWHPSIHMPRVASRILLEVTGVRVERLQDISEADAAAEGLVVRAGAAAFNASGLPEYGLPEWADGTPGETRWNVSAVQAYRSIWTEIKGPGNWDANPWVWVVEFKVVRP